MCAFIAARRLPRHSSLWTSLGRAHLRFFSASGARSAADTISEFKAVPDAASAKITDYAKWLAPSTRKLHVVFCPDPGPGLQTGLFDAQPTMDNFASVFLGTDDSLEVAGPGQFDASLADEGYPPAVFEKVHQELMSVACKSPGMLVAAGSDSLGEQQIIEAAFGMVAAVDGRAFVAIDIFKKELRPLHCENVAMIHCVWPERQSFQNDMEFLEALQLLGEVIAHACNSYNARVANDLARRGLPPLWRVRMGLVSHGNQAGKLPDQVVASSLLKGLAIGTAVKIDTGFGAQEGDEMEFEMASGGGAFQVAWGKLQQNVHT